LCLLFICAFVVSTLVIYSVYYYSHINKYQGGVVVMADELKNTIISPEIKADKAKKNFILFTGLLQAFGKNEPGLSFADTNRILTNAPYSVDLDEKLNVEISRKFPGHPPISFPGLKPGDKLLFSYFFQNIHLPQGFYYGMKKDSHGVEYKTLRYSPAVGKASGSDVSILGSKDSFLLQINLSANEEAVFVSIPNIDANSISDSAALWSGLEEQKLKKSVTVEVPFLDFSITRRKNGKDIDTVIKNHLAKGAKPYSFTEERMKLKTSPPLAGTNINKELLKADDYTYRYPVLFYLKYKNAKAPYFAVILRNPELLVKLHL
jgi:hypothetical protein